MREYQKKKRTLKISFTRVIFDGALFGGAPPCRGALSGLGRRPPPGAYPSGSAIGVLVVTWFGSGFVVSRPLPPLAAALVAHRPLTSIAMLAPFASRQTPPAACPSQARDTQQTVSSASARSARRFHAGRIGGKLAGVRPAPQGARLAPTGGGGGLLCCSLASLGRRAPQGYGRAIAAVSTRLRVRSLGVAAAPSPRQPIGARLPRRYHQTPTLRRLAPAPLLAPLASLQTPSAPNPSQARGSVQTTPFASARSARRFHAARIGERLAGVRNATQGARLAPTGGGGGLLCCSLASLGRRAPKGYGRAVAACCQDSRQRPPRSSL